MSNIFETATNFFNQSVDDATTTIFGQTNQVLQTLKLDVSSNEPTQSSFVQQDKNIEPDEPSKLLVPFEKQFESQYVGCYFDDPVNPSMDTLLGNIKNISECIEMGKNKDFRYVGIRSGNECWASNNIPNTHSDDRFKFCNVGCSDIGTGNCGGNFYNQVYKTMKPTSSANNKELILEQEMEKENIDEAVNVLENFISSDNDLKKISIGLENDNFNYWKPINMYQIFFWLVIFLFLIYLLFEYLYRKKQERLI